MLPKLTAGKPENGWLEDDRFLLGWPIFRCELLVSGTVDARNLRMTKTCSFFSHNDIESNAKLLCLLQVY